MLIHKLRLHHGWSQEQLATLSGVSARTIQRIEAGGTPSTESLKAIAAVFAVDWSDLKETAMHNSFTPSIATDEALALAQVRHVKRFYLHAIQFLIVMGALIAIDLVFTPGTLWFVWPLAFWGIGLIAHALIAFDKVPFLNGEWERRQVERRLGRLLPRA